MEVSLIEKVYKADISFRMSLDDNLSFLPSKMFKDNENDELGSSLTK